METLLPVGDVELCVDTVGSPTDIPLLLIGTTVATWDDELVERLTGRFVIRYDLRDTGRSTTVDPASPGYTLHATSSPTPSACSTVSASPVRTSGASGPAVSSPSSWRWTTRRGSPRSC
jgi:hypothetical protein